MGVVCVVVEYWSNCERYEDYADHREILEVAGNNSIAECIILERRKELIKKAEEYANAEKDDYAKYAANTNKDGLYEITFTHSMRGNPFDTFNFGTDYFRWSIEDHEIIES